MAGLPLDHEERLARARLSLEGLSTGDAFGERFFTDPAKVLEMLRERTVPSSTWRFTDDTVMGCGVFLTLQQHGRVDENALARTLARLHDRDMTRGYGAGAHRVLQRIHANGDWFRHTTELFRGEGSFGNGGAMRAGPVGGYFADDYAKVVDEADKSAIVTHAHKEGRAGAVAVAVATAHAWLHRGNAEEFRSTLYDVCLQYTPRGHVWDGIERARNTPPGSSVELAVQRLGNGVEISAPDTVPLALWCAHRHIDDFGEALWTTVSALGDRDTTCAIVGSIVSVYVGIEDIPSEWRERRERLDDWIDPSPLPDC